jgi:hypothetical protein
MKIKVPIKTDIPMIKSPVLSPINSFEKIPTNTPIKTK